MDNVSPEEKARLKKLRALQRREARKLNRKSKNTSSDTSAPSPDTAYLPTYQRDDWQWIRRSKAQAIANGILNDYPSRPFWLSIPRQPRGEPVAQFFPCSYFLTSSRIFYGFLFQEHRDTLFNQWKRELHARKEFFETVSAIRSRRSS